MNVYAHRRRTTDTISLGREGFTNLSLYGLPTLSSQLMDLCSTSTSTVLAVSSSAADDFLSTL